MEHVDLENFKANVDTAHFCAQRENVVLALTKLSGRFADIHIADNDSINPEHLSIGRGIIDWNEFFRVLKRMDYEGYLGLDLGLTDSLAEDYRASLERIKAIVSELDLTFKI